MVLCFRLDFNTMFYLQGTLVRERGVLNMVKSLYYEKNPHLTSYLKLSQISNLLFLNL